MNFIKDVTRLFCLKTIDISIAFLATIFMVEFVNMVDIQDGVTVGSFFINFEGILLGGVIPIIIFFILTIGMRQNIKLLNRNIYAKNHKHKMNMLITANIAVLLLFSYWQLTREIATLLFYVDLLLLVYYMLTENNGLLVFVKQIFTDNNLYLLELDGDRYIGVKNNTYIDYNLIKNYQKKDINKSLIYTVIMLLVLDVFIFITDIVQFSDMVIGIFVIMFALGACEMIIYINSDDDAIFWLHILILPISLASISIATLLLNQVFFKEVFTLKVQLIATVVTIVILFWFIAELYQRGIKIQKNNIETEVDEVIDEGIGKKRKYIGKNRSDEERQILHAVYENKTGKAILVSGPWGSGKSYVINRLFPERLEVDLLKYGSGQNIFYSVYQAIVKPYNSLNFKINMYNLLKTPELLYIVAIVNASLFGFIKLSDTLFFSDTLSELHLTALIILIIIVNLICIQILPFIVFSRDLEINRFRALYLELIKHGSRGSIIVFENLDRLNDEEIHTVLEVINYLNESGVKVIVGADINYLKKQSDKRLCGEATDTFVTTYLSRYFKDVIEIEKQYFVKLKKLKAIARKEGVFVALYEWKIIAEILNQLGENLNIRELEDFTIKYNSQPKYNQFSFELFLYVNEIKQLKFKILSSKDIKLTESWLRVVSRAYKGDQKLYPSNLVSNNDVQAIELFEDKYIYSAFPYMQISLSPSRSWKANNLDINSEKLEEMHINCITSIVLTNVEQILLEELFEVMGISLFKKISNKILNNELFENEALIEYVSNILGENGISFTNCDLNKVLCKFYINTIKLI